MRDTRSIRELIQCQRAGWSLEQRFYTDPEIYAIELDRILTRNWIFVGHQSQLAENGDYLVANVANESAIVVRTVNGDIRAFANVCRHRGSIVCLEQRGNTRKFQCPYHGWMYDTEGKLIAARNMPDGFDQVSRGLHALPLEVVHGLIFICFCDDPPGMEPARRKLTEPLAMFDFQNMKVAAQKTYPIAANWKLAVENYCEGYHLPFIHPGLNSYSRLEDHYNIEAPGMFSGQGTTVYNPQLDPDGRRFQDFPDMPEKWDGAAEYVALYPNALLGVHRDHVFAMILMPQDVARTEENVAIYYADATMTGAARADLRARNAAVWRAIFEEDIGVVEGMQQGRAGRAFDGGVFSPVMDGPTHCFHRWAAEMITRGGASA